MSHVARAGINKQLQWILKLFYRRWWVLMTITISCTLDMHARQHQSDRTCAHAIMWLAYQGHEVNWRLTWSVEVRGPPIWSSGSGSTGLGPRMSLLCSPWSWEPCSLTTINVIKLHCNGLPNWSQQCNGSAVTIAQIFSFLFPSHTCSPSNYHYITSRNF